MNFNVSAVDTPQVAASVRSEQCVHLRPQTTSAPSTKASIDRIPRSKIFWQVSPLHSCPQDITNPTHHSTVVFRRPPARAAINDTPCACIIRSIFLSAPRADQVNLADLMESYKEHIDSQQLTLKVKFENTT